MLSMRLSLGAKTRKKREGLRHNASRRGAVRPSNRLLVMETVAKRQRPAEIAAVLTVSVEAIPLGVRAFLLKGVEGLQSLWPDRVLSRVLL